MVKRIAILGSTDRSAGKRPIVESLGPACQVVALTAGQGTPCSPHRWDVFNQLAVLSKAMPRRWPKICRFPAGLSPGQRAGAGGSLAR